MKGLRKEERDRYAGIKLKRETYERIHHIKAQIIMVGTDKISNITHKKITLRDISLDSVINLALDLLFDILSTLNKR